MNNTEKKLDALINALGFDVEEKHVLDGVAYWDQCRAYSGLLHLKANKEDHIHPEFKFTKRDAPVDDDSIKVSDWIGQGPANKPPLGIPPKTIHDGLREEEIISAMIRYLKDRKAIPDSWRTELDALQAARS
tara:strand:- start:672 stop:1067 length:396 start_codon:yes stop_codon:yes gene_type:complete